MTTLLLLAAVASAASDERLAALEKRLAILEAREAEPNKLMMCETSTMRAADVSEGDAEAAFSSAEHASARERAATEEAARGTAGAPAYDGPTGGIGGPLAPGSRATLRWEASAAEACVRVSVEQVQLVQ